MKRRKMSRKKSKKYFSKTASKVNQVNRWSPLRGGIRL
jgi:hypothetical protein